MTVAGEISASRYCAERAAFSCKKPFPAFPFAGCPASTGPCLFFFIHGHSLYGIWEWRISHRQSTPLNLPRDATCMFRRQLSATCPGSPGSSRLRHGLPCWSAPVRSGISCERPSGHRWRCQFLNPCGGFTPPVRVGCVSAHLSGDSP